MYCKTVDDDVTRAQQHTQGNTQPAANNKQASATTNNNNTLSRVYWAQSLIGDGLFGLYALDALAFYAFGVVLPDVWFQAFRPLRAYGVWPCIGSGPNLP